jgi:hypothetical protein
MDELKELEFLANKSREMVEKQIASYRQKRASAGTVIGITALFISFFLNGLDNAFLLIQLLSIIPVGLLFWVIIIMLGVLRTQELYQFFSVEKFKDLIGYTYEQILLYEIGSNNESFRDNKPIDETVNDKYNFGIRLTIVAIIFSIGLLLANKFYQPGKSPTKVQILNCNTMTEKVKTDSSRVIPVVPPSERERLNEGVNKPPRTTQPQQAKPSK